MRALAEIITAAVAALSLLGGGVAFIWKKMETRFVEIEDKLNDCEKRETAGQTRRAQQLTVIEILWQEVLRLSPGKQSPVLRRARHLLDEMKATDKNAD